MKTTGYFIFFSLFCVLASCQKLDKNENASIHKSTKEYQDSIVNRHLKNGAWNYWMYSQDWQDEIDKGIQADSTIAYLYQQKAMPLIKQGKYEIGLSLLDKAVKFDRQKWQDYRAFVKCIFAKRYRDAIVDFNDCKQRFGDAYVMDHSYDFYLGLSYLQLNEFKKAEETFKSDYDYIIKTKGKDWLHHLDLFYFGIAKYELRKYEEAIELFNMALEIYPKFSDVQAYKAICLNKLGKRNEAIELDKLAELNGKAGNSINEDNVDYERYPYQIRWD